MAGGYMTRGEVSSAGRCKGGEFTGGVEVERVGGYVAGVEVWRVGGSTGGGHVCGFLVEM